MCKEMPMEPAIVEEALNCIHALFEQNIKQLLFPQSQREWVEKPPNTI